MHNIIESQPHMYIRHEVTGLPLRTPSYVRQELRKGSSEGELLVSLISKNIFVTSKHENHALPNNRAENAKLIKLGAQVSQRLSEIAQEQGIERYCTVMHGSLALGTTRSKSDRDPSDIDVDLVIDDNSLSKNYRTAIREKMRYHIRTSGHKIDSYVWTIDEMKYNAGQCARIYLASAALPHINVGNLWHDVVSIGIENERFHRLPKPVRKKAAAILARLENGDTDALSDITMQGEGCSDALDTYFKQIGLPHNEEATQVARSIRQILFASKKSTSEERNKPRTRTNKLPEQTIYPYALDTSHAIFEVKGGEKSMVESKLTQHPWRGNGDSLSQNAATMKSGQVQAGTGDSGEVQKALLHPEPTSPEGIKNAYAEAMSAIFPDIAQSAREGEHPSKLASVEMETRLRFLSENPGALDVLFEK